MWGVPVSLRYPLATVYFHLKFRKISIRRTATEEDSHMRSESKYMMYRLVMRSTLRYLRRFRFVPKLLPSSDNLSHRRNCLQVSTRTRRNFFIQRYSICLGMNISPSCLDPSRVLRSDSNGIRQNPQLRSQPSTSLRQASFDLASSLQCYPNH